MVSHRRTPQPGLAARTTRVTVLSAAAASAALAGTAAQRAAADPGAAPQDTATRIDGLYQQAEQATQRYDAAQERTRQLRADLTALEDRAAATQQRVNELRDEMGVLAASQYREGAIDPTLALLLSDDPADFLDRASAIDRLGGQQGERLRQLQEAERGLRQQRGQATQKLADLRRTGAQLAARKRDVQRALVAARALLRTLPPAQRAAYAAGDPYGDPRASRDRGAGLPDLAHLGDLPAPSGRAALAVAAARRAIGAPYVWGATGPNAFDCSGLMQYAYRRAGVSLPRTSQEQMNAGVRVPLSQARPGDLVIYRADASHVAMYIGGGRVIHAPYPGARVRVDRVDMMPVTAVTRP
ncbi:NlpC/P60 family protein [Actinacidiphila sp. DG2A-62]|uniref:C40 family peptidase n=1 Tax=Actinacidiphila sp. DG2A-62 TaxID=3108821 RepID=UPI002DC00D3A|nr:NlpC/P60 family protein [Actinacidiphila sp. DG2A-62]MEC3993577.1 NlpC/P60 family protein [Actinacidiphila sp. DG2A-62]